MEIGAFSMTDHQPPDLVRTGINSLSEARHDDHPASRVVVAPNACLVIGTAS